MRRRYPTQDQVRGFAAVEAAESVLTDEDEAVRRTAAWLLVAAGGLDQGRDRLGAAADPVARVALMEAMAMARKVAS
jgi:HEAT repeat protein